MILNGQPATEALAAWNLSEEFLPEPLHTQFRLLVPDADEDLSAQIGRRNLI